MTLGSSGLARGPFQNLGRQGFAKGFVNGDMARYRFVGGCMANLYRITALLFLCFVASQVQAADTPMSYSANCGIGPGVGPSADAACQAVPLGAGYHMSRAEGGFCVGGFGSESEHAFSNCRVVEFCPDGYLPVAGASICRQPAPVCTPPAVVDSATNTCVNATNSCPKAGAKAGTWTFPGKTGAKEACDRDTGSGDGALPGCHMAGNSTFAAGGYPAGPGVDSGGWSSTADMTYDGNKCSGGAGNGTPEQPKRDNGPACTPPKVAGKVNGVDTCYTPSSATSTESKPPLKTVTSTQPDGTETKTQTGTETKCLSGLCTTVITTTTTSTPSGGTIGAPQVNTTTTTCMQGPGCSPAAPSPVTTVTTTNSQSPSSPAGSTTTSSTTTSSSSGGGGGGNCTGSNCGDGPDSAFSAACGAPPACAGDALMCAIAAATFKTDCELSTPPATDSPLVTQYKTEAAKSQGDQTTAGATTVNISSSSFDQTNLLGSSVGVSDLSVTVAGRTVSLPFSTLNIWFERLGFVLRAVTLLMCARILIRG